MSCDISGTFLRNETTFLFFFLLGIRVIIIITAQINWQAKTICMVKANTLLESKKWELMKMY